MSASTALSSSDTLSRRVGRRRWLPALLCTALSSLAGATEGGIMQGFPPAPQSRVTKANAFVPPYLRWTVSHAREVSATRAIARAEAALPLPAGQALPLDGLSFAVGAERMALLDFLQATATDGFIVLHRGKIVYERYSQGFQPRQPHIWASMTKSITGLLAAQFIAEGRLDPQARLAHYVPELHGTPFGESTVQQNLDMEVAVAYPDGVPPDLGLFAATGLIPRRPGMPENIYAFLQVAKMPQDGATAPQFFYQNGSAEAVAWVLRKVSGQSWAELVQQHLWSRFALDDAYVQVDELGTEMASGGISANLHDSARFAELLRREGARTDRGDTFTQAVRESFRPHGNQALFAQGNLAPGRPGYGYHNYWFQKNDGMGSMEASGRFGQKIYINPQREVVVVKLSATSDLVPRATSAAGGVKLAPRPIDAPTAFNSMVDALLQALR